VSDTLVKVDTDVNADRHQSSTTTGRACAPNGLDPLRQLFARPWNSSSGGPATVSDAEPDVCRDQSNVGLIISSRPYSLKLAGRRTRAQSR
jgi:hypothetical protein